MNRITSPQELLNELRRLQAACVGGQPSRGKLASELRGLANRVAARVSPSRVLDYIRVFRVKYKSEGVSPSVTEDCQKVYGDAMRIVNDVKDRQWAKIFADRPGQLPLRKRRGLTRRFSPSRTELGVSS